MLKLMQELADDPPLPPKVEDEMIARQQASRRASCRSSCTSCLTKKNRPSLPDWTFLSYILVHTHLETYLWENGRE